MAHVDQARLVAADPPGRFHGDRVAGVGGHFGSEDVGEPLPTRRFAQVVGVRLECQSPGGNMGSLEVAEAYVPETKSIPSPSPAFLGPPLVLRKPSSAW
jgi:hypothetical protein